MENPPPAPRGTLQFSPWQVGLLLIVAVLATALLTRMLAPAPGPAPAPPTALARAVATLTATPTAHLTSTPTPTATATPSATPTPTRTPVAVIDKVLSLGRLETADYGMQVVIEMSSDAGNPFPWLPLRQKILLVAAGDVIAGVDLTKVAPGDITVRGSQVSVRLPPAEILVTNVDNRRTYLYEDQKPIFLPADKGLEGRARQAAEEQMTRQALERGILDRAQEYAQYRLEAFLRSLGFTEVNIRFGTSGGF